ncbi:MAG: BolA protein [Candidatus Endobugula sp.]
MPNTSPSAEHTSIQNIVEAKLRTAFSPQVFELHNESYMHNVPQGSESHFKAIIVSDMFAGLRPVQRQQKVYEVLADELAGGIHALSMQTLTAVEWKASPIKLTSPPCMGGGKT